MKGRREQPPKVPKDIASDLERTGLHAEALTQLPSVMAILTRDNGIEDGQAAILVPTDSPFYARIQKSQNEGHKVRSFTLSNPREVLAISGVKFFKKLLRLGHPGDVHVIAVGPCSPPRQTSS